MHSIQQTKHYSLMRCPCPSQFLLICYFMELFHFHKVSMSSPLKRYKSTWQKPSVLLGHPFPSFLTWGHSKSTDVSMWLHSLLQFAYLVLAWTGICVLPPPLQYPHFYVSYFHFISKVCVLLQLKNMFKAELCLLQGTIHQFCVRLASFTHYKFYPSAQKHATISYI